MVSCFQLSVIVFTALNFKCCVFQLFNLISQEMDLMDLELN